MKQDLLFELGCEELPSFAVYKLPEALLNHLNTVFTAAGLSFKASHFFATPRRISVYYQDLDSWLPAKTEIKKGPSVDKAYDANGAPTPALSGFMRSLSITTADLTEQEDEKGRYVIYTREVPKQSVVSLIPEWFQSALKTLPIAKHMRWGEREDSFVRPVHWAVLMYGAEIIPAEFYGITTDRVTYGHRFHAPSAILLKHPGEYEDKLLNAYVVADFSKRRARIQASLEDFENTLDAKVVGSEDLLHEVTSIVEWPVPLLAKFDESFLEVPKEVLTASIHQHQKCFPLIDSKGQLLPCFIAVSNIESTRPESVIQGNERVMRARLSDAAFFWKQDNLNPLSSLIDRTKTVLFQAKLGSIYDKTERMKHLLNTLSTQMSFNIDEVMRSASLSKCDLLTGMVGEFPELQGVMGYYYALNSGESESIAIAIDEHYYPRFAEDILPETLSGKLLSIVDRIDTLVGIFSIGERPTGDKDPFKLRRHALALIRLLESLPQSISLASLIQSSVETHKNTFNINELTSFILDRLFGYYETLGIAQDVVRSVLAVQNDCFIDIQKRIQALHGFYRTDVQSTLSSMSKRVDNLLSSAKYNLNGVPLDTVLLSHPAEIHLMSTLAEFNQYADTLSYSDYLSRLSSLQMPLNQFFDDIMVMVEDKSIRDARLNLLSSVQKRLMHVGDIRLLQVT